jgi:hypothetical protein
MGALLQIIKELILILTTGYIVYLIFNDYKKTIIWYLFLYAIISMLGIGRAIYFENLLIPILLLIVLLYQPTQVSRPNIFYGIFFIYILAITFINGLSITNSYSGGIYLFVVLLIYSSHLFSNSNYAIKIVFLIWLVTLGIGLNFLIFGESPFSVSNINSEERNMVLDMGSTFGGSSSSRFYDLNYFSSGQAFGALLSMLFLIYRKYIINNIKLPYEIKRFIFGKFFTFTLLAIIGIQLWLMVRGLSRGGLLVFLVGILTLVYILKKSKYILYGGLLVLLLYWVMNEVGITDLFMERITKDETGTSGRDFIWLGMLTSAYKNGGVLQIIFGQGIDWPWWDFWPDNTWGTAVSSHNQWLTLLINFGIVGLILFIIPLIKGVVNSFNNPNPINNIRIVLFFSFFAMTLSLEPLVYTRYVWFIVAISATYSPAIKRVSTSNRL